MSDDKIRTLHPEGKQGVNISRAKYDAVHAAILAALRERDGEIPLQELFRTVEQNLAGQFEGSVGWYTEAVKLDLEARGVIERIPGRRPQVLRLRA